MQSARWTSPGPPGLPPLGRPCRAVPAGSARTLGRFAANMRGQLGVGDVVRCGGRAMNATPQRLEMAKISVPSLLKNYPGKFQKNLAAEIGRVAYTSDGAGGHFRGRDNCGGGVAFSGPRCHPPASPANRVLPWHAAPSRIQPSRRGRRRCTGGRASCVGQGRGCGWRCGSLMLSPDTSQQMWGFPCLPRRTHTLPW